MRFSALFAALSPVAVSALVINPQQAFCSAETAIITALKQQTEATSFCSPYLHIPTSTKTSTSTITPSSLTSTVTTSVTAATPFTSTVTASATVITTIQTTDTIIQTLTLSTTSTTSTSSITCLDSAYTASTPVGTLAKRGATVTVSQPACIPQTWAASLVSSACSCLSIPTPTTTITAYTTLAPGTVYVTTTSTITPVTTVTTTQTSTSTTVNTNYITTTATVTQTYYAVATTIVPDHFAYREYTHSFDALGADNFEASYFKSATMNFNGTQETLTFSTPNWPSGSDYLTLSDGQEFYATQAAVLLQGFFIASETGTYTFSSSSSYIDNWGYLWTGDVAYSSWNDSNTDFQASRTGSGYYGGSSSVTMNAGDAMPMTWLWANGGGVGQSWFEVTLPDGSSTTDTSSYLVSACSSSTFT